MFDESALYLQSSQAIDSLGFVTINRSHLNFIDDQVEICIGADMNRYGWSRERSLIKRPMYSRRLDADCALIEFQLKEANVGYDPIDIGHDRIFEAGDELVRIDLKMIRNNIWSIQSSKLEWLEKCVSKNGSYTVDCHAFFDFATPKTGIPFDIGRTVKFKIIDVMNSVTVLKKLRPLRDGGFGIKINERCNDE